MITALLSTLLCAAPATGLTLSAELGKVTTPAATYLDVIEQELVASGVPVRRLSLSCNAERECLIRGVKAANLASLVAVTVAHGKKQTTIDLEAIRSTDGTTASQLTFSATSRISEADRASLRRFGSQLATAIAEPLVTDTPRAEPKPEPVVVTAPASPVEAITQPAPKPQRSSAPGWLLGGGAVAAAATSGIFLGLATGARGTLESTPDPSPLTRAQADQLAADANRDYSIALGAGIAAGALLTATIIWLASE